jgi:alpha-tubulin suppressor-like RCC1 family protein
LGIETSDSTLNQLQPAKIEHVKEKKWKQIAMGAEHACALTDEGIVYVWGSNEDGQCGQARKHDTVKTPRELRIEYAVNAM